MTNMLKLFYYHRNEANKYIFRMKLSLLDFYRWREASLNPVVFNCLRPSPPRGSRDPCRWTHVSSLSAAPPAGFTLIKFHPRIRGDELGIPPGQIIQTGTFLPLTEKIITGLWRELLRNLNDCLSRIWDTLQIHSLCTNSSCSVQCLEPVRIFSIHCGWAAGNCQPFSTR